MSVRVKHVVEYAVVKVIVGIVRIIPHRIAIGVAWCIAWLFFHVIRFRVKEARSRIVEVFGDRFSEKEITRIAWRSLRNFIIGTMEVSRLSSVTRKWIEKHVENYEAGTGVVRTHCAEGKGAVLACPHMGSWELAGVVMQQFDVPIFFLTGKQKNPLVDAYLNKMRSATGIKTIGRGSGMLKGVIRSLRNGEVLGFLPDVRQRTEGVRVQFLGKEANVVGGMGLFARQADVPIFPSIAKRNGLAGHRIKVLDPIWPDKSIDKKEDWQRMTQQVFSLIEKEIRAEPDQWFWFNKRWILDPLEEVD